MVAIVLSCKQRCRYVVHVTMCRLDIMSLLWWFLCEQEFKLQLVLSYVAHVDLFRYVC